MPAAATPEAEAERRRKIGEAVRRRYQDPAERERTGRLSRHPQSAETRERISVTLRGHSVSPAARAKIAATLRRPDDDLTVLGAHARLRREHPLSGRCERCGEKPQPSTRRDGRMHPGTEYAFLRHPEPYTTRRKDYLELCVPCHRKLDAADRAARRTNEEGAPEGTPS